MEKITEQEEMLQKPDYANEITAIVKENDDINVISKMLDNYHDNDIAEALEEFEIIDRIKLYNALGNERMSEVIAYVDDAVRYLHEMGKEAAADVIEEMDADDAVDLLEEMEEEQADSLLELVDGQTRHDIELIQSYEEDEIGSEMTTNFIVVSRDMTIKQAMKSMVEQAAENDNISTLYVVENEKLYGAIDLKELILARNYQNLEEIIITSYPYVHATDKISECIQDIRDYAEDSIPVLDNDNKLIGVITAQDVIEVVDDELADDYAKLAALTEEEDLNEPLKDSIKKRTPWLIVLLCLSILVSSVVASFEQVVSQLTIIISFQSLILGMAGNVGTQSLAVTIRVLMEEDIHSKEKLKFIWKEAKVGFCNGFLLGILSFIIIGLFLMIKGETVMFSFAVSGCTGIALMLAMLISGVVGTSIPIIFKKINIDPAVASGPLITTVNDLLGVVIYYGLAWIFLINMLQL